MRTLLWIASLISTLAGGLLFMAAFFAGGAPAQAAAAGLACAIVIIPYVAARSWDELTAKAPAPVAKVAPQITSAAAVEGEGV